jgi:hypothetical protein
MLRDDENARLREACPDGLYKFQRIAAPESQVEQQQVRLVPLDGGRRADDAISFRTDDEVLFPADQLDQALPKKRVIVDNDDADAGR